MFVHRLSTTDSVDYNQKEKEVNSHIMLVSDAKLNRKCKFYAKEEVETKEVR